MVEITIGLGDSRFGSVISDPVTITSSSRVSLRAASSWAACAMPQDRTVETPTARPLAAPILAERFISPPPMLNVVVMYELVCAYDMPSCSPVASALRAHSPLLDVPGRARTAMRSPW